jgi:P2-related tail formation protein
LVGDQPQIDLAPEGPETSRAQVLPSSSSSPRLPWCTINWNHTLWQEDWFEDNEDMQALQTNIVTINHALTAGVLRRVVVALLYVIEVLLTILSCCGSR